MSVERFVRFVDETGVTAYGELPLSATGTLKGLSVSVLAGDPLDGFSKTGKQATIKEVLSPLERTPIFQCIGLNYAQHAKEADIPIPIHPVVFTKPANAIAGPHEDVPIHLDAQSQLDYEGELCVIISKDCKNVPESEALDYVLGYTAGNDVSARNFQVPNTVSGGQFGYAKSFDKFAPIGPTVLMAKGVDPQNLSYTTKVNGEVRQQTSTSDMIWSVKQIIAHLSRGTTLQKGTVIMTGTPSGVGFFMGPGGFLKDGDVVEIGIEGIGSLVNKMVFEK